MFAKHVDKVKISPGSHIFGKHDPNRTEYTKDKFEKAPLEPEVLMIENARCIAGRLQNDARPLPCLRLSLPHGARLRSRSAGFLRLAHVLLPLTALRHNTLRAVRPTPQL